jgi:hypothetical protein
MDDRTTILITELATWNGRLSATIEGALIDLKYGRVEQATKLLTERLGEYDAYRDAEFTRITGRPVPAI